MTPVGARVGRADQPTVSALTEVRRPRRPPDHAAAAQLASSDMSSANRIAVRNPPDDLKGESIAPVTPKPEHTASASLPMRCRQPVHQLTMPPPALGKPPTALRMTAWPTVAARAPYLVKHTKPDRTSRKRPGLANTP